MRVIGNVLWLLLAGWWLALGYAVAGVVMCIMVITIPFGVQAFKLAGLVLWPFGRAVVERGDQTASLPVIGNVLWIVLGGWQLAVGHLVAGALLCLTIIGIPLGLASFRMVLIALVPFGKTIVPAEDVGAFGTAVRF